MTFRVPFALLAGMVLGSDVQTARGATNLETFETLYAAHKSNDGIGADEQANVAKSFKLIEQGELAAADAIVDGVLIKFSTLIAASNRTYVCFGSAKDLQQFLAEEKTKGGSESVKMVTRVSLCFAQALQLKAYIASSR